MGWGKIRKSIQKLGDKGLEPHAAGINLLKQHTSFGARTQKNIEQEGTKGVAQYGGIAGGVALVVPGVGTGVGVGLMAASAAAQIKLKQDAVAKYNAQQRAYDAQNPLGDTQLVQPVADQSGTQSPPFAPVPRQPSAGTGYAGTAVIDGADQIAPSTTAPGWGSLLSGFMQNSPSTGPATSLAATGESPSPATPQSIVGADDSFFERYKVPILVLSGIASIVTIFAIMRR